MDLYISSLRLVPAVGMPANLALDLHIWQASCEVIIQGSISKFAQWSVLKS